MGLCKCPKKKVTNLFCFEHKVNVCEHCLVESHDRCIVKSYLQWLEDSDYNPICTICSKALQNDDKECVRLVCYDVFHLKCLDEISNKLPDTTAPAGYECPSCTKSIIPQSNQIGPLVDNLNSKLSKSDWFQRSMVGRISDDTETENFELVDSELKSNDEQATKYYSGLERQVQESQAFKVTHSSETVQHCKEDHVHVPEHSVYQIPDIEDSTPIYTDIRKSAAGNKPTQATSITIPGRKPVLEDDNKYSRKPLMTHISTLIKAHFPYSTSRRSPQKAYYYFMLTLVLGLVLFILFLWFFSVLGRYSADNDPMLDPRFNPNLNFAKVDKLESPENIDIVRGGSNLEPPNIR